MLSALHIQDFVLIESLKAPLGVGLTALTGETGAGKAILLEALGFAAGGRATRGGVRDGAKSGVVSAAFEPPADHAVWRLLEENGFMLEDDQVILRRVQRADGKGRAFINDQPASIASLRMIGASLLEIHGQHDGRGFLTVAMHRTLLDDFGAHQIDVENVRSLWRAWREAQETLAERRSAFDQNMREAEYLRFVSQELSELNTERGEEAALADRRADLIAAEKVAEDLDAALKLLADESLESSLASSARRLSKAAAKFASDPATLNAAIDRLDSALSEVAEARGAIELAASQLTFDAEEVSLVEERLFRIRAAMRKYGALQADDLIDVLSRAREALSGLEKGEADFAALEAKVQKLGASYRRAAQGLTRKRVAAAAGLEAAMALELAPLKLGKAVFKVSIDTDIEKPGENGIDQVEFMVATNAGAALGPLKSVASGGELSRFVLAMKAALAQKESRTVIIFDEVDAGVGGAVADAVGERLSRLANDAQVLVVTHSPQVAARADTHWLIEKSDSTKGGVLTKVRVLDPGDRVEEVARMLSGATVTDEARAAAASLLGGPEKPSPRRKSA